MLVFNNVQAGMWINISRMSETNNGLASREGVRCQLSEGLRQVRRL